MAALIGARCHLSDRRWPLAGTLDPFVLFHQSEGQLVCYKGKHPALFPFPSLGLSEFLSLSGPDVSDKWEGREDQESPFQYECSRICLPHSSCLPRHSVGDVAVNSPGMTPTSTGLWGQTPAQLFATPWTPEQASLSITNSWSPPKSKSIESVMPSNHLILCHLLLLMPSIFPMVSLREAFAVCTPPCPKPSARRPGS